MQSASLVLLVFVVKGLLSVDALPHFNIDLDLPPRERWLDVATAYKQELIAILGTFHSYIDHIGHENRDVFLKHAEFGVDYEEELQGFVDTVNSTNVTMKILKCWNLIYEMTATTACSGALWALPNGTVMHGRNLDYKHDYTLSDGRVGHMQNVTFSATAYRNGMKLWSQAGLAGIIGHITAMRYGDPEQMQGWGFQQNTRYSNRWQANLEAAKQGGQPFPLVARRIMETTPDYKTAVEQLYSAKLMAPQYFVVSGGGAFEGTVLTMGRLGIHAAGSPAPQHVTNSSWYLVQANDDLGDDHGDRRPLAIALLNKSDRQEGTPDSLMQFMHTTALFVPPEWSGSGYGTVYSTVMVPATGYFKVALATELPAVQDIHAHPHAPRVQLKLPDNMPASFLSSRPQQDDVSPDDTRPPAPSIRVVTMARRKRFLAQSKELSLMQLQVKLQKRSIAHDEM